MNLNEKIPGITHEQFCESLARAFRNKWSDRKVNERVLTKRDLENVEELMKIYEDSKKWEWRFGQTPEFKNSIEKKFDWALIDMSFNVEKGKIKEG